MLESKGGGVGRSLRPWWLGALWLVWVGVASAHDREARVTLDLKDADIRGVVTALAETAGSQVVFDPGVSCRLTISARRLVWLKALRASLDACGLGYEEEGTVLRIATRAKLTAEAAERRQLAEAEQQARTRGIGLFRLSYARARAMAPLIKATLSGRGEVVFDDRTNTLIIVD
jgi:type IV pilus assembly protein PilQ